MTERSQSAAGEKHGFSVRQLDAWLLSGGRVVAASERTARFVEVEFNRARRAAGLKAWADPKIFTWTSFVKRGWELAQEYARTVDDRMVLTTAQELAVWESIVAESESVQTLLSGPRHRLAILASEAHHLLAHYATNALDRRMRSGWQRDAEEMSAWLAAFEERCQRERLLNVSRLPYELLKALEAEARASKAIATRPPLRLVGFDRLEPVQRELLTAWGEWELVEYEAPAKNTTYFQASDAAAELATCALWCNQKLKANPAARLLVITSEVGERRGEIERAFGRWLNVEHYPSIEFSLGLALSKITLVHSAELLLRWFSEPLSEHELDWLFSTGRAAQSAEEAASLQRLMRTLRRWQKEQPEWSLNAFCKVANGAAERSAILQEDSALERWIARMRAAQSGIFEVAGAKLNIRKTPLEWSTFLPELLNLTSWPGCHTLESAEEQARSRFLQTVESLCELGFDGRRILWSDFVNLLSQSLTETLFAPESREASILIVGPAESAGLSADGIWFLGVQEGSWPSTGTTNPLLPVGLQRDAEMPHSTAQVDWELARRMTERLLYTAPEVRFSFAALRGDEEAKPSRLIEQIVGAAQLLPKEFIAPLAIKPQTESVDESRMIPFLQPKVSGGAQLLTLQSLCPFKAFATYRLGAESWNDAEVGLSAAQRGQLLHQLMVAIWSGPEQQGLKTLDDLRALVGAPTIEFEAKNELENFVRNHAHRVLQREIPQELRARLLPSYIEIEEQRLTRLVSEWLRYESARQAFEVLALEEKHTVEVAGLAIDVRLDRMDRLKNGSLLVIDYKTGDVKPKLWQLPRPEDVQLPLYACFAVNRSADHNNQENEAKENLGGLAFAKIRVKNLGFAGKIRNTSETLFAALKLTNTLMKNELTDEMLYDWRDEIERLAHEFIQGDAEVDPRQPFATCEKCDLKVLCRVYEGDVQNEEEDERDDEEESDE
jgi:ATP-dependent helicase/nuclease subunit B